jgi:GNAT superfamily N-acetyltransferase
MEFRTLQKEEREAVLALLDQWDLPDGWRGRNYFRRYIDYDPTYRDENIWVAAEGDQLLGCCQIFPRRIRVLGHAIPAGGIGSVFTTESRRGERIASLLLEAAVDAMVKREMEVSLLFAQRIDFYEGRGWDSWKSDRSLLSRASNTPPNGGSGGDTDGGVEIVPFDRERDLAAVKAIHSAYSASRNGTVVRDDGDWEASLCLAGNPLEEFMVARKDGATVAYVRAALLNGILTLTELGRREDSAVALAELIRHTLEERENDELSPRGLSSRELRSAAMLPAFDDLQLTISLEHRGLTTSAVEDPSGMLRCLNMSALAERMDIALFPDERPDDFLKRILPRDLLVFWPADRF